MKGFLSFLIIVSSMILVIPMWFLIADVIVNGRDALLLDLVDNIDK